MIIKRNLILILIFTPMVNYESLLFSKNRIVDCQNILPLLEIGCSARR